MTAREARTEAEGELRAGAPVPQVRGRIPSPLDPLVAALARAVDRLEGTAG